MGTRETWREAYGALLSAGQAIGLPAEVGKMLASNLHSERAMRRMISYLKNAHPTSMEEIADEMVAILEDRDNWIRHKQSEEAQSRYNAYLNSDLRE